MVSLESQFSGPDYATSPIRTRQYTIDMYGERTKETFLKVLDYFEELFQGGKKLDNLEASAVNNILAILRKEKTALELLKTRSVEQENNLKSIVAAIRVGEIALGEHADVPAERRRIKSIDAMTVDELVAEMQGRFFRDAQRLKELIDRAIIVVGSVKDAKKKAELKARIGLADITRGGDPGKPDFGVFQPAIWPALTNSSVSLLDLARGVFYEHPNPGTEATVEQLNKAPITETLIEVWDYIVARIKHHPEFGGINNDPAPGGNLDFSYKALAEDRVPEFIAHLEAKFGSRVPKDRLSLMITFAQNMDVKSLAYLSWQMRETTRGHGTIAATLNKVEFSDTLYTSAPMAFGFYSRGRYGSNKPDATGEDALFMSKHTFAKMVESAAHLNNRSPHDTHHKVEGAEELWDVVESFREAVWGEIPGWVIDVREMIDDGRLDLDKSWYPLPGEILIDNLKLEVQKRKWEKLPPGPTKDTLRKALFAKYYPLGFVTRPDLSDLGVQRLNGMGYDNLDSAFKATTTMWSTFQETPKQIEPAQAKHMFEEWIDKVIGKAKLVPGRHHLLMGPMTVRYIYRLTHSSTVRTDAYAVEELRAAFIHELDGSSGVPEYVKEYVKKYLDKKFIPSLVRADRTIKEEAYKRKLYLFQNRTRESIAARFNALLPGGIGKAGEDSLPIRVVSPWHGKTVDKDTSH